MILKQKYRHDIACIAIKRSINGLERTYIKLSIVFSRRFNTILYLLTFSLRQIESYESINRINEFSQNFSSVFFFSLLNPNPEGLMPIQWKCPYVQCCCTYHETLIQRKCLRFILLIFFFILKKRKNRTYAR